MVLICSSCGQALAPADKFCSECGTPRPRFCTECGAVLPGTAKFCSECGTQVPADIPSVAAEPQLPSLPEGLREKFEAVRDELQGERREVVVVFADISGYTAMSERMDPEDVTVLMNRVLQNLAAAVYDFEGYVDKFIGDAVMALFGAPLAHENDPERAVLAGLAMQEVIDRHNQSALVPLALRVGINVGEVVAAHLGSEGRLQYTVLGDTVNVASRLEGKAEPGSVLVSENVHERLGGRFDAEEVPPLELKGKSKPVRAWRIRSYRGKPEIHREESTPFVGRDAELATVGRFLTGIGEGRARPFLIEAEPGAGKSRLVREALARFGESLLTIPMSLSPIRLPGQLPPPVELFSHLLPPGVTSPADWALELLGTDSESHRLGVLDLVHRLQPGETEAPTSPETDPAAARQNRWVALGALLHATTRGRPALIWVEDVHWIGEEAAELLTFLLGSTREARVGFLLTSRPGVEIPWIPAETERLHLEPLGEEAAAALLGDLTRELSVEQRRELIRRSHGNPLFIEELVRALRAEGERGLAAVPSTLQGLIKSRIDKLGQASKTLLDMAAVLGLRFPGALLHRMYALERLTTPFDASLVNLEQEGFLELQDGPAGECRFHHALMQEVTYGSLLVRLRKVLHESAARIGEEYYAGQQESEAGFFGHHYWYAGLEEEAAPHLWIAGRSAAEAFDLQLAEKYLSRAAQVVDEKPEILGTAERLAELEESLGMVLLNRGRLDEADARFRRLESLGERENWSEWRARGIELQGRAAWYRGQLDEAERLFERGLACTSQNGERVAAAIHNNLGIVHYYRGDVDRAFAEHTAALDLRVRIDDRPGMAKSFINIGNLLVDFRDDLEGAEEHYRRALAIAEELGSRELLCTTLNNLATVMQDRGEWEPAIATLRRAEKVLEEMGWAHARYVNLQNQAACEISLGRISVALDHLDACLRRGDAILEPVNRVNTRLFLFDAYLRAMAYEKAEQMLEDARRLQEELRVQEAEKGVLLRAGRWHVAWGRWKEAAEAFQGSTAAARRENQPAYAALVEAHYRRAVARAGQSELPSAPETPPGRPPTAGLLEYLDADATAALDPVAAAERLERVADMAAVLREVALERAACERRASLLEEMGDVAAAREVILRAARAIQSLAAGLPADLREGFLHHPRNAGLLSLLTPASERGD